MRSCFLRWFSRGLLAVAFGSIASALPVFPGAVGFGSQTVAGRGGEVYRVTNLNNSGTGSLRYGVENISGPRVIIFDVSGVIPLQSDIMVRNDGHSHLTIAGQTAPPPGITLKNAGINIRTHDILIQHIAIRAGNYTTGATGWNLPGLDMRDCIKMGGTSTDAPYNIVIDHVTCSWATDETFEVYGNGGAKPYNITFSNCIIGTPILYGGHPKGRHGYGALVGLNATGATNESVSLIRNLWPFNWARNPRIANETSGAQVVNNVVYRPGPHATFGSINVQPLRPATVSAVGNVFIRHPVPFTIYPDNADPIVTDTVETQVVSVQSDSSTGISMYVNHNSLYDPNIPAWFTSNQWSTPLYSEGTVTTHLGSDPHANSGGTTWSPWTTNVEAQVLATVGKHPAYRDEIDAPLISNVQSHGPATTPGVGTFISQMNPATNPWAPVDIRQTRVLALPNNPSGDDDGDNYTNLEEWLHDWAAIVEGTVPPPSGSELVGHWKLDETTGQTAADSSGQGNVGTISGGTAVWTAGQLAGGLQFDGVDDQVNAGSGASLDNLPAMTVSAWIKADSTGEGSLARIVEKGSGEAPTTAGWFFSVQGTNVLAFTSDYQTTDLRRKTAVNAFTTGGWHHVAVTWTGSATATGAKIYVDGSEVGSYDITDNGVGAKIDDSSANLYIGNSSLGTRTFDGVLDDVRVYNYVLSASEILALAQSTPPTITTTSPLPQGYTTIVYPNQQLAATGGTTPYTWSLASGTLPAGITGPTSGGVISGTPTTAETANFTVRVTDAASQFADKPLSITINANSIPSITTTTLPGGTIGVAYNQSVASTGGDGALLWSVSVPSLPAGLALSNINSQNATISGTPTGPADTSNFTLQLADVHSDSDTQALSISVAGDSTPPSVSITDPDEDATVSGSTQPVAADASDNIGVVGVQFKLDGANLGSEDVSPPFAITWDTTTASDGPHVLTAVARDAANNTTTSAPIDVTVDNLPTTYDGWVASFGTDVVSYWKFENNGTDEEGVANATITGSPELDVPTIVDLDTTAEGAPANGEVIAWSGGTGQYANVAHNAAHKTPAGTIVVTFQRDAAAEKSVLVAADSNSAAGGFSIEVNTDGSSRAFLKNAAGSAVVLTGQAGDVQLGEAYTQILKWGTGGLSLALYDDTGTLVRRVTNALTDGVTGTSTIRFGAWHTDSSHHDGPFGRVVWLSRRIGDAEEADLARAKTITRGEASIAFRAASNTNTGAGGTTSITVPKPAGVVSGDFMLAGISSGAGGASVVSAPAGWTLVRSITDGVRLFIYKKQAGASEPANYTWSFDISTKKAGGIVAFSGVSSSTPIQVENGVAEGTTAKTAHTTPTISTTGSSTWLVSMFADRKQSGANPSTWTPPAGATERVDARTTGAGNNASVAINTQGPVSAGSKSHTSTGSVSNAEAAMEIIALQP